MPILDPSEGFQTVHPGHENVQEYQVDLLRLEQIEGRGPVLNEHGTHAEVLRDEIAQDGEEEALVVHHERGTRGIRGFVAGAGRGLGFGIGRRLWDE